jgi:hypothetical protein
MIKHVKKHFLLSTLLFSLLLISCLYSSLVTPVYAAEPTAPEKAMVVLNDVVGLNVTAYTVHLNAHRDTEFWGLPQEEADFSFTSNQGKVRMRCSFVNNRLRQIYTSDYNGSLSLKQPTFKTLDMAKGFLERYQNYSGDSFYGKLRSMLDTVSTNENITQTIGNVELEVSVLNEAIVNFIWTYKSENGISAPLKNVVLSYENGLLKSFLDNWQLYEIAGEPKISREEAIDIALKASESFSYEVNTANSTITVSDFKIKEIGEATLSYLNYEQRYARDGDQFTLFPSWYVPLGFDNIYPGSVTGVTLRIWADTGKVSSMDPMVFGGVPFPEESIPAALNQEPNLLLTVPFLIASVVGLVGVSFSIKKAGFSRLKGVRKLGSSRLWGILLCLLISFSMILIPVLNVNAVNPQGKAMIYASMYGQVGDEPEAAYNVTNFLQSRFLAAGYSTTNAFNTSTTKNNVLTWAQSMEQQYYRVALFHFGHGGIVDGDHDYFDNSGNPIWDYEIYPKTSLGKHFFVWLWVCRQGDDPDSGMPVAWTHRSDLAPDGYTDPDDGPHCFIGFEGASPCIGNATGSFEFYTYPASWFIQKFYWYALDEAYSVNDALNIASGEFFNRPYDVCPLHEGFRTWWPKNDFFPEPPPQNEWYNGTMHVYGNGDIKLSQHHVEVRAYDNYDNPVYTNVYVDSHHVGSTFTDPWVAPGTHTISVPTWADDHHVFSHFGGYPAGQNQITVEVTSDTLLWAYYDYYIPPQYHYVSTGSFYFLNGQYHQFEVPFKIDGQEEGPTGDTYQVTEDYHTFEVPDIAYAWPGGGGGGCIKFVWWYWVGSANPIGFTVEQDVGLYAIYEVIILP